MVLAEWAAIAIENARLYQDSERRRDELERAVRRLEATTAIARAVGGETDLDADPRADRQARPGADRRARPRDPAARARRPGRRRQAGDVPPEVHGAHLAGERDALGLAGRDGAAGPARLPRPVARDAGRARRARRRRRRAAPAGLRRQRRDRRRDRTHRRGTAPARRDARGRGRAPALGARAARRHAPGPRRAADAAQRATRTRDPERLRDGGGGGRRTARGGDRRPARADPRAAPRGPRRARRWPRRSKGSRTRTADRAGIAVTADVRLPGARYAPELETALYRIVQEAVNNAVRHAGARAVEIESPRPTASCMPACAMTAAASTPARRATASA